MSPSASAPWTLASGPSPSPCGQRMGSANLDRSGAPRPGSRRRCRQTLGTFASGPSVLPCGEPDALTPPSMTEQAKASRQNQRPSRRPSLARARGDPPPAILGRTATGWRRVRTSPVRGRPQLGSPAIVASSLRAKSYAKKLHPPHVLDQLPPACVRSIRRQPTKMPARATASGLPRAHFARRPFLAPITPAAPPLIYPPFIRVLLHGNVV